MRSVHGVAWARRLQAELARAPCREGQRRGGEPGEGRRDRRDDAQHRPGDRGLHSGPDYGRGGRPGGVRGNLVDGRLWTMPVSRAPTPRSWWRPPAKRSSWTCSGLGQCLAHTASRFLDLMRRHTPSLRFRYLVVSHYRLCLFGVRRSVLAQLPGTVGSSHHQASVVVRCVLFAVLRCALVLFRRPLRRPLRRPRRRPPLRPRPLSPSSAAPSAAPSSVFTVVHPILPLHQPTASLPFCRAPPRPLWRVHRELLTQFCRFISAFPYLHSPVDDLKQPHSKCPGHQFTLQTYGHQSYRCEAHTKPQFPSMIAALPSVAIPHRLVPHQYPPNIYPPNRGCSYV